MCSWTRLSRLENTWSYCAKTSNTCWTRKATDRIKLGNCYKNFAHINLWQLFTPLPNTGTLRGVISTTLLSLTERISDAIFRVTGYLRHTPKDSLFLLAGIKQADLQQKRATLALARGIKGPFAA